MRSVGRFHVLVILAAAACAHRPEPAPSPTVTPLGAAALAVLRQGGLAKGPVVVVTAHNIPLLEQDLVALADTVWLWTSDSAYGGERRFEVLPDSYYNLLDLREIGNSGDTAQTFKAMLETCAGWPCHSKYRIRVRRNGTGFVPDSVQMVSVE
jgi:hypothetical protein